MCEDGISCTHKNRVNSGSTRAGQMHQALFYRGEREYFTG